VAVKLLAARHVGDARMRQHFATEIELLRALAVEGVPRHVADGTLSERPFVAMQWLPGRRLAEGLAQRRPLTVGDAGQLVLAVLDVLARIHDRGWVHGDVAPSNILVARVAPARVGLIDFGLARRIAADGGSDEICGTPPYMAPEVSVGAPASVASDLYGVGVVLRELLTGTPFMGWRDAGASPSEALDEVIWSAVRPDPAARCATALALREALARALAASERSLRVVRPTSRSGTSLIVTAPERIDRLEHIAGRR
jgi:serine/threonine-protein kinase